MIYKGFEIVEFFEKYVVFSRDYIVYEHESLSGCRNWIDGNLQRNFDKGNEISLFSENYINGKSGVLLNIDEKSFTVALFDGRKKYQNQLMISQKFAYGKSDFRSK